MNKKRASIIVSTLLVLVLSFSLLAGCGLDLNFRKKTEKKGWTYTESGRSLAQAEASTALESKDRTAKVEKAIKKVKAAANIAKTVDLKVYAIAYIEFDDLSSANTYFSALKKSTKERQEKAKYEAEKRIAELDKLIKEAGQHGVSEQIFKERDRLANEINDKNNQVIVKKSGKVVSFGTKASFNEYSKNK